MGNRTKVPQHSMSRHNMTNPDKPGNDYPDMPEIEITL